MTLSSRLPLLLWILAAATTAAFQAQAIPPGTPVARLHRSIWASKEGAPVDAWVISQTIDGWMWFGSPDGLYRFDGTAFERVETEPAGTGHSRAVSAMLSLASGDLAIGYHNGGVAVRHGAQTVNYHEMDGFDSATVFSIAEDRDHHLWAATRTGLLRFDGRSWTRFDSSRGLPSGPTFEVGASGDGRIWVATSNRLYRLDHGASSFVADAQTGQAADIVIARDGRAWYETGGELRPCPIQPGDAMEARDFSARESSVVLFDKPGGVWAVSDSILLHVASPLGLGTLRRWVGHSIDEFRRSLGPNAVLAAPLNTKTMARSRGGALWMTTVDGEVEEIRDVAIAAAGSSDRINLGGGMAATSDGAVWVAVRATFAGATAGDGLWRVDGVQRRIQATQIPAASMLHVARDGTLWVAGDDALWRRTSHGFVRDIGAPIKGALNQVLEIADEVDTQSLWVSVYGSGLFLRRGDAWQRNGGVTGLPDNEPTALANDAAGAAWMGYANGRVVKVAHGQVVQDLSRPGAQVGSVRVLSAGRFVLVGGDRGLALLRDGKFQLLTTDEPRPFEGLTGIVETPEGDVWLNGQGGLTRIAGSELDAALRTGSPIVKARLFDARDGYPGNGATRQPMGNSLALAPDGKLWFAAHSSIGSLDPAVIPAVEARVPLVLRSATTSGGHADVAGPLHLAAGTRDLQIDYAALDYDYPDRERFRYRLSGLEERWTNVGPRRQAFFTNLGPGHYRFEVESTNGIVEWQSDPVTLEVDIPPTFLQSRYFMAICVMAGVLALVLLIRTRERQLRQRESIKLNERLTERERIARELHDTLLQSTQGLALKVQAATSRIDRETPARAMLEEALHDADRLMIEGRDRIQELRVEASAAQSLESAFGQLARQLVGEREVAFRIGIDGTVRALRPLVAQEALRIGSEALRNAFRHAHASQIEVQIVFGNDGFRVRVRDDGIGIDAKVLHEGSAPGRWGLHGMRERALRAGASLEVWSAPGAGTEVEFRARSSVAYADTKAGAWSRSWRRWRRLAERDGSSTERPGERPHP